MRWPASNVNCTCSSIQTGPWGTASRRAPLASGATSATKPLTEVFKTKKKRWWCVQNKTTTTTLCSLLCSITKKAKKFLYFSLYLSVLFYLTLDTLIASSSSSSWHKQTHKHTHINQNTIFLTTSELPPNSFSYSNDNLSLLDLEWFLLGVRAKFELNYFLKFGWLSLSLSATKWKKEISPCSFINISYDLVCFLCCWLCLFDCFSLSLSSLCGCVADFYFFLSLRYLFCYIYCFLSPQIIFFDEGFLFL